MSPVEALAEPPQVPRRRWRRRALIAIVSLAALAIVHGPLLRGVGSFLIADEPLVKADYVVILPSVAGDNAAIDQAIELVRRGDATGLLFFQMPPMRGERCGAWPAYETAIRGYLKGKGIADNAVTFIPGSSHNSWEAARALGTWSVARKPAQFEILVQEYRGRYERHIFASVLPDSVVSHLHFVTVAGRFDSSNWWHDREGIQVVFQNYARLAFIEINGESKSSGTEWTFEQYEQSLPPAPTTK